MQNLLQSLSDFLWNTSHSQIFMSSPFFTLLPLFSITASKKWHRLLTPLFFPFLQSFHLFLAKINAANFYLYKYLIYIIIRATSLNSEVKKKNFTGIKHRVKMEQQKFIDFSLHFFLRS